jgi:hypothetical protein
MQYIDDVFFAFVLLAWSTASFAFAGMWIYYELYVKRRYSNPKSGLWIDFTPVEELNEFAPNEITKSGLDFYRSLSKDVQGDWLKFIKYGCAPKVLHFDCRASEGSINLFTFDGIVKREQKPMKVRSIKHFLSRIRVVPDMLIRFEKFFRLRTLSKIVKQFLKATWKNFSKALMVFTTVRMLFKAQRLREASKKPFSTCFKRSSPMFLLPRFRRNLNSQVTCKTRREFEGGVCSERRTRALRGTCRSVRALASVVRNPWCRDQRRRALDAGHHDKVLRLTFLAVLF